jgi:cytochrome c-type protein NapC
MTPWVNDLTNPDSETLAAKHFDRRWIAHDQCYTCHTDYVLFGRVNAKTRGMRHVAAYYLAPARREIELYEPFLNANCLQCHGDARGYRENPVHEAAAEQIASGETKCPDCHAPIHPPRDEAAE